MNASRLCRLAVIMSEGRYSVDIEEGVIYGVKGNPLTPRIDGDGYAQVVLYLNGGKTKRYNYAIHEVVACISGLDILNKQVNHKNGRKDSNGFANLEAVTPLQNIRHAYRTGLINATKGSASIHAKLIEEQIPEIRRLYATGDYSQLQLSVMYGVSDSTIQSIVSRRTWKHV